MKDKVKDFYNLLSFARQLDSRGLFGYVWMFILVCIILLGFVALIMQIIHGHEITGMRDHVVWGIYISNFVFFMGVSYAGGIFSGLLVLFRVSWRAPIVRITQLVSVTCGLIGPLYILLCLGRIDRVYLLLIHGRIPSPIIWDIFVMITYLVGNIAFLYLLLVPDLAYLRDSNELRLPNWRIKVYRFLSINYKNTEKQQKDLRIALKTLAAILIPISVFLTTILSWIFGMTLRPGWNSTIFGPYFVFAALYSGIAVVILLMWVFRKRYNLKEYITDMHFRYVGIALVVIAFVYAYFNFNEYFSMWYSFKKWDAQLIKRLLDFKQYGWLFLFTNIIGIIIPILIVGIKKLQSISSIGIASIIILVGMWVKRYISIIPTLETPLFPIQDARPEYVHYSATWVEWILTLSGLALFLFLVTVVTKLIPIVQLTESILNKPAKKLEKKQD
ncbi:MAG: polysulfide reductase NrfD [Bacteroidetes bacterium]|jgi:Ni/Fe-hydrogenase subunit HybB-like protein|nr:polysulfide reductase NrfD [Bacteroidota bacterium]MBT5530504.1 polysulfide reductase NrfD [Cytophagia bacterium]MBT4338761.1 polysulfide reductase NrfD [Bacteroidota bacterium]MBT5992329.1 polysulfide reductase NrfD [Bacteroidota bacterium]MBT6834449.1 polysulfide reductase NrfD [Bacteroidota bacterium]